MNVEVERLPHCYCRLIVTLSAEEVDKAFDKATRRVGKEARVPGFRPGKVPQALLERQFGDAIEQQATDAIIKDTLFEAIANHKLNTIERPSVESVNVKRGATGRYVATVELFPEVKEVRYKDLPAPIWVDAKVDEKDIDERIESERSNAADTVPVEGRNTIEQGDYVLADYEGMHEGQPIDRGSQQGALVHIAEGNFIPGFVEGLIGKTVPGEATVDLHFPENYGQEALAGKPAQFHFRLHELKAQRLPALDDEFARDCGHDSLDAMRQSIRDELKERAQKAVDGKNDDLLIDALVKHNPFELSAGIIDRRCEEMIDEQEQQLQQMVGGTYRIDENRRIDLRTSMREQAETSVRASLLISELSKAIGVNADEAELDAFIDDWRKRREAAGEVTGEAYEAYVHSEQGRQAITFEVRRRKAMTALREATNAPTPAA